MNKAAGAVASGKARENAFKQGEATFKDRPLTEAEPQTSEIFLSECGGCLGTGREKIYGTCKQTGACASTRR